MTKYLIIMALTAGVTGILVWEFAPKQKERIEIPKIVTVYDTINKLPDWFRDSVRIWKSRKSTTDTVNIVISETIVDTQLVNVTVGCDSAAVAARPKEWPIRSYNSGGSFGDTAFVTTFDIRSGRLGISKIFTAGILTAIEADSDATPRITYRPFPARRGATFFDKVKWAGVGFASCSIYNQVTN